MYILLLSMPGGGEWIFILLVFSLLIYFFRKFRIFALLTFGVIITIVSIFGLTYVSQQESSLTGALRDTFDQEYNSQMGLVKSGSYTGIFIGAIFLILGIISYMKNNNKNAEKFVVVSSKEKSNTETLEKLYELKEKGILSEEEYSEEKKKIINKGL